VLDRLLGFAARAACAVVGAGVVVGLIAGLRAIVAPEVAAWAGRGMWIAALAGAAAGAGLARVGWPPGRLLCAMPRRGFVALAFAAALGSGIWAHFAVQKGVPDVPDELGYLHQARGFADGVLAPPSPPLSEFHYVSWGTHDRGLWYAVFPPGYGALLALGVAAGVPWLVNPLLGALLVLALFALARDLLGGDGLAARVAVLVYLGSWFRLMHAGSFMAHPTAALFTVLAVLGAWRGMVAGGSPWWAVASGASLGALAATRPLNAAILALVLLPVALRHWRRLWPAAAGLAPLALAYGAYNAALTGAPTLTPQERYIQLKEERGDCFRLGFGPGVGQCPITQNTHFGKDGFQPKHAANNTGRRLDAYLRYTFAFSPLAVLLAVGALGGARVASRRGLAAGLLVATVLGYALFFYHGVAYGARFYYETFPFAALLVAAGLADVAGWLAGRPLVRGALGGFWLTLVITGLVAARPAIEQHAGRRNRTMDGKQLAALADPKLGDGVVFVDSMIIPAAATPHPARIEDNHPMVVRDLGDAANAGFMRLHADRKPWRLLGTRLVPLAYSPIADIVHEGGALYPLEIAENGFGERVDSGRAWNLPLSTGAALRFRARAAGARFAFPTWVPREGASRMRLVLVAHGGGPDVQLTVDGARVFPVFPTREPRPRLVTVDIPTRIAPGRHWIEVTLHTPGDLFLDHVELR
jgi:4-amino-4-deoxy-L-arabinose transferase-like glycosyltransferase